MDRASWAAISKDPEIWKKVGVGAASLLLVLPTPIALGIVNADLETEAQRIQDKEPPSKVTTLPSVDGLLNLFMSGIGPTVIYALALFVFAMASIPTGLTFFQLSALFRPPNELVPELHAEVHLPFMSVVIYILIGLGGLALQAVIAATIPVALAQYARGKDIRPALAPLSNALTVLSMGSGYWVRAAGVALGLVGMTFIVITSSFGLPWIFSTLLCFLVSAAAFVSLVLASRHAFEYISAELPKSDLPPLPAVETARHTLD